MGNERGATYQAKVSVCHYSCMGNGIMSGKGQCSVLQQSCGMRHGSGASAGPAPRATVRR